MRGLVPHYNNSMAETQVEEGTGEQSPQRPWPNRKEDYELLEVIGKSYSL